MNCPHCKIELPSGRPTRCYACGGSITYSAPFTFFWYWKMCSVVFWFLIGYFTWDPTKILESIWVPMAAGVILGLPAAFYMRFMMARKE
jgi:hypothetical protein